MWGMLFLSGSVGISLDIGLKNSRQSSPSRSSEFEKETRLGRETFPKGVLC